VENINQNLKSLYDYVEGVLSFLPEGAGWLRCRTPKGFREMSQKLIAHAITHLEADGNRHRSAAEDAITSAAIGFLNRYGIATFSQVNNRGHVDIYMKHAWKPGLVICGEAKIWRGVAYHVSGLRQVLGYATGRYPFCFVLAYVQSGRIADHISNLTDHLNSAVPEDQQGACTPHDYIVWGLVAQHKHTSGNNIEVLHAGVNLV